MILLFSYGKNKCCHDWVNLQTTYKVWYGILLYSVLVYLYAGSIFTVVVRVAKFPGADVGVFPEKWQSEMYMYSL